MRACTAVVTEISYHRQNEIEADVSFLSYEDWKNELSSLIVDLTDENNDLRRDIDPKSEAGIAWQKVCCAFSRE